MAFIRKVKTTSGTYLAEVESYRKKGKVKQRFLRYIGKEIDGKPVRRVSTEDIEIKSVKQSMDVLAIHRIAEEIGITSLKDKNILVLAYAHLLEQRSIHKMEEWLRFTEIPDVLGMDKISSSGLYRSLTAFHEENFEQIERNLADFFMSREKHGKAVVIDVTDTYFDGRSLDVEKRRGKDGKVRKLVQVGLAVTFDNGFPLMHNEYHGNLSNIQILKDMVMKTGQKGLKTVIIDRGMSSEENLKVLHNMNHDVIAGVKKNESLVRRFINPIQRNEMFALKNMVQLKNTKVYIKSFPYSSGKLIGVYSPSKEVVQKELGFEKGIARTTSHAGYSFIYNTTTLPDKDAVKKYYDKDIVERAFKQLKSVLNLRPIRVWLKGNIESHIRICYLAYAILAFMDYKLRKIGISSVDALKSLRYGYKVTLNDKTKNHSWSLLVPLEPKQKDILKRLGVVYKI